LTEQTDFSQENDFPFKKGSIQPFIVKISISIKAQPFKVNADRFVGQTRDFQNRSSRGFFYATIH
jgi:hypothetical protein